MEPPQTISPSTKGVILTDKVRTFITSLLTKEPPRSFGGRRGGVIRIASESSHVLITVFGAMNTVIAGLVAYLKSRGQPMRARMYRDDMHRVVDEIENSEVMWLGISRGILGYEADDEVTVRSEVARLTRLYDRAVKTNTMNYPDIYSAGAEGTPGIQRPRPSPPLPPPDPPQPPVPQPATATGPAPAPAPVPAPDPDESPATKPTPPPPPPPPATEAPKDDKEEPSAKDNKPDTTPHAGAPEPPPPSDTAKDASKAGHMAEPAAEPTAGGDDILDDPSNPTIRVEPHKTAATGSSN